MVIFPVERIILRIICVLAIIDAITLYIKSVSVDIAGYAGCLALGVMLVILGQFYRISGRDPRLGSVLMAAGMYILFTIAASVFNYIFLPISFPPIDAVLLKVDTFIGYSWPDAVIWAALHPWVGKILFFVYMTSLPQLLVILITLGFTGESRKLECFMLTGTIGALVSIGFWIFFPTFGAKAYHTLPEWVSYAIPLAVDSHYGQQLLRLGREGIDHLSPANILGLIGFPSFHIFMSLMSVFFVPRHMVFMLLIGTLNLLMLPAALIQGGHHLSDVFGGIACFSLVYPVSFYLVKKLSADVSSGEVQIQSKVFLPTNG